MEEKHAYGTLIWITGLAGSGKTTIASGVYEKLKQEYPNTVHLDGDVMRDILGEQSAHDLEGRIRTAEIYSKFCSLLTSQGINVVMSTISLFRNIHNYNRKNNQSYYEILLNVNKDTLHKRNKKGLYQGSSENMMGIDQQPEFPVNPDVVLENNSKFQIKDNINKILALVEK